MLEAERPESRAARACQLFLVALILLNVIAVTLETVDVFWQRYSGFFLWFEAISVAIFSAEYAFRLWSAVDDPRERFHHPVMGRLRYGVTFFALVDLLAILPFYLAILTGLDFGAMRAIRLLRILKLTRYSPAIATLGAVLYNERRGLYGAVVIMLVLLVASSTVVYYLERAAQPESFASIPAAMWWALASLTTVGYGDITPITPLGRLFGGVVTILGVGMFAIPAGILASGFVEEVKRRDFVITWTLVASVPLFGHLVAPRIAEIAKRLEPRIVPAGAVIVRKGEPASSMYFIASGEAEVDVPPEPVVLNAGQFFGEMALLDGGERTATVRTRTECRLLELSVDDFEQLMEDDDELRETVRQVAEERRRVFAEAAKRKAREAASDAGRESAE